MIKRIISALLIIALFVISLSLTSCHGKRSLNPFVVPEEFCEDERVEITFWIKNDNHTAQKAIYEKAIADFEALYPSIKVKLRSMYNYDDIYKDVLTNIRTDTTPNVCITYPDHVASYLTGTNIVVPLDDLINDERYGMGGSELKFNSVTRDEMIEKYMLEGQIDGTQYTLPFMRSTEACYINADLVEALGYTIPEDGLTWDFVFEVSNKAMQPVGTDKDGNPIYINGQTSIVPFIYKSTDNMMIQMLKQKGYGYSNENAEILMFNDDTKGLLYMLADQVKSGAFSTHDIANAYPGDLINQGRGIFGVDSTAGATWIGSDAPNMEITDDVVVKFRTVVTEIPQFDKNNPAVISQGPSICIFNKANPNEVLASWIFTQYILTDELQIAFAQTEGYVPVTESAQNAPEYIDYLSRAGEDNDMYYDVKIAATKVVLNSVDHSFITPAFNGSASLRKAAGLMIEESGKAVNRGIKLDDAYVENLYKKATALYKLEELGGTGDVKKEFGTMPKESVLMICVLGTAWLGIGSYYVASYLKKRKNNKTNLT